MIKIDLKGLDVLIKRFDKLGKDISKYEIKAVKAAAEILQEEISRRAPKSSEPRKSTPKQKWRTEEHLADNIEVSRIRRDEYGAPYVKVGPAIKKGSPYFYGMFHEYGTTKMKATPFIQPSVEIKKNEMVEAMKKELKKGLGI